MLFQHKEMTSALGEKRLPNVRPGKARIEFNITAPPVACETGRAKPFELMV